jgi:NUMOD3 motif
MKLSTKRFYVYEHWRPDEGVIFYVGKGQKRRAWDWHRGRNAWHKFIIAKLRRNGLKVEVRIVHYFEYEKDALVKERELITAWKATGAELVNLTDGGEGPSGLRHSEEWKQAMSVKMTGRIWSDESRAKLSASMMGNKNGVGQTRTPEQIKSFVDRCGPKTPEQIKRMSESRKGVPTPWLFTPEAIAKRAEAQRGVPKSPETRKKMSLHKKSDEHKRKLSEVNLGKTHSDETRAKISAISKALWDKRRAEGTVSEIARKIAEGKVSNKNSRGQLPLLLEKQE